MSSPIASARRWTPTVDELVITARLVRFPPILAAAVIGTVIVWRGHLGGDLADVVLAGALAAASAGILGDRAATSLDASPTTRGHRAAARLLLVGPVVGASWVIARGVARSLELDATPDLPVRWIPGVAPALVLVTFVVGAIAIDATVDRVGATSGMAGASTVLIGAAVTLHLPGALNPYPVAEHRWWWWASAAALAAVLVLALTDPGRSPHPWRDRRTDDRGRDLARFTSVPVSEDPDTR